MNKINLAEIVRYSDDIPKVKELILFTNKQLKYYSKTGKRYNNLNSLSKIVKLSQNTTSKYIKIILDNIFKNRINAITVYDMIFGKVITSYHKIQRICKNLKIKLLTSPTEWFNLIQNREQKSIRSLSIRIQFECGHITMKLIHNLKKRGCGVCSLIENQKNLYGRLNYEQVLDLAQNRNLLLLSSKEEFEHSITMLRDKNRKKPSDSFFLWQCKKCKRIFKNRYSNIKWHGTGCPLCSIGKEQRIAHLYCEYIFNQKFDINKSILEIFNIEDIPDQINHHNIHIDSFCVLKFNDRVIHLGIEYDGLQHQNSKEGWETYNFLSHNNCTSKDWKKLIERDELKVHLFRRFNIFNYYLIVIPYNIKRNKCFQYIIDQFKLKTRISIVKEFIDWKDLYYNELKKKQEQKDK